MLLLAESTFGTGVPAREEGELGAFGSAAFCAAAFLAATALARRSCNRSLGLLLVEEDLETPEAERHQRM